MASKPWSEAEKKKAVAAFKKVHPEFTVVSNSAHCPKCLRKDGTRRMYCAYHRWAYEGWLSTSAMITLIALRDRQLLQALKAASLWFD
jgi:hypothetical protein